MVASASTRRGSHIGVDVGWSRFERRSLLEATPNAVAPGAPVWVVHESQEQRRPRPLCSGHLGQVVGDDPARWSRAVLRVAMPRSERIRLFLERFEGLFRVKQVIVIAVVAVEVFAPQPQPEVSGETSCLIT